jgi:DNA invertase Pin-like site-specific DNA recombinase
MKIGYARVSTEEQSLTLQLTALKRAECEVVHTDHGVSGSHISRSGLNAALSALREGDVLVVWRLDRLGRSLSHLVALVDKLGQHGIEFMSLTESIDTKSSGGRLMFHMMAALAEFERALISERTRAGLAAAKVNGTRLGRRPAMSPKQITEARLMLEQHTPAVVAKKYGVHRRTLQRVLKEKATNAI